MNPQLIFWIVFIALAIIVVLFSLKYEMLKDKSSAEHKPYSYARVQLTWWTVIILASFITILLFKGIIPDFHFSTLILLGISSLTTATGRLIDISDQINPQITRAQDDNSENFILDILSDENGVSIHRLQTIVFNLSFGIWFICTVIYNLNNFNGDVNRIIPIVKEPNLILLGISSGVYAGMKTIENKSNNAAVKNLN